MVLSKKADFYPLMTYIRSFSVAIDLDAGLSTEQLIRASQMSNKGLNAAKVFVALIPMLIVYPFVQKYFVKSIMIGAVKG
jgi:putative aldouronate transport system permease protein